MGKAVYVMCKWLVAMPLFWIIIPLVAVTSLNYDDFVEEMKSIYWVSGRFR